MMHSIPYINEYYFTKQVRYSGVMVSNDSY